MTDHDIPVKDAEGNVIGKVLSYAFDPKTQTIAATMEIDGQEIAASVPVGMTDQEADRTPPVFARPRVIGPNTDDGPYDWSWQYGDPVPRLVQVDWLPGSEFRDEWRP